MIQYVYMCTCTYQYIPGYHCYHLQTGTCLRQHDEAKTAKKNMKVT